MVGGKLGKRKTIYYLHDGGVFEEKMAIQKNRGYSVTISFSDVTDYARFLMFAVETFIPKQNVVRVDEGSELDTAVEAQVT